MKNLLLVLLFVPLVAFGQEKSEEINVNITSENTTANSIGAFNSARMKEWQNMRKRRLQKYTYGPSKKTATKLLRANKVIGLPLDAGISQEHMKKWFPEIAVKRPQTPSSSILWPCWYAWLVKQGNRYPEKF